MPTTELLVPTQQTPSRAANGPVPLRADTLYTNHKGKEKKSLRQRATKMLSQLEAPLRMLLEPGETILYIAPGQAPVTAMEHLAFGWYVVMMSRNALVVTDRRLVRLALDRKGGWKHAVKTVRWSDISEAKVPGLLLPTCLRLKYADGTREKYWGIGVGDARKLRLLLTQLVKPSSQPRPNAAGLTALCPSCAATLTPRQYTCMRCRLEFKDESTMVRRSIMIPGGGYFYCRHWLLGVGDFVGELVLLAMVIVHLALAVGALPAGLLDGGANPGPDQYWLMTAIFAGILGFEKWLTIHHCRRFVRDFIPLRTDFQKRS